MDAQDHLESRANDDPVTRMIVSELFSADHIPIHITSLISANYHKIFHLKALKDRGGTNVADILRGLKITESSETTTDDTPVAQTAPAINEQEREDIHTRFLATKCMKLRQNICRNYERPIEEAELIIKASLERMGRTPLPFCGHKSNLDDLCMLLYAAVSAVVHPSASPPVPSHQPTDFVLEFVDFLNLAGGRPASSFPWPCNVDSTWDEFIETVRSVYDYLDDVSTWQEGAFDDWDDLPAEEEVEGWRFQCAAQIGDLDMALISWKAVSVGTFGAFGMAARSARCFVIHVRQLEIFSAIKAKQRYLQANSQYGTWTWALWGTEEAEKASEVPYVPLMYVPAFEADDLPSLSPPASSKEAVKQGKEKKRQLPTRTPEEQAAKKSLAIRARKRKRDV